MDVPLIETGHIFNEWSVKLWMKVPQCAKNGRWGALSEEDDCLRLLKSLSWCVWGEGAVSEPLNVIKLLFSLLLLHTYYLNALNDLGHLLVMHWVKLSCLKFLFVIASLETNLFNFGDLLHMSKRNTCNMLCIYTMACNLKFTSKHYLKHMSTSFIKLNISHKSCYQNN